MVGYCPGVLITAPPPVKSFYEAFNIRLELIMIYFSQTEARDVFTSCNDIN